jgi:MFS family permease
METGRTHDNENPAIRTPQPLAYEPAAEERAASVTPTEDVLEERPRDPYSAWRHRDFTLFSIGWATALLGLQVQSTAIGWEVFQHTGRPLDLAWVGLVQAIPILALALPAGYVADRFDRRIVVMITQSAVCLCSMALGVISYFSSRGTISFAWLYLPLFLSAIGFTFGRAARHALLPGLVPAAVFNNAVTWNSSIFETCAVLGPMAGGLVIAAISKSRFQVSWLPYGLSAVGQGVWLVLLSWIRARPVIRREDRRGDWYAGIRFVWGNPLVLGTISLDLFAVLLGGATALLPAYATRILGVGSIGFGALRAAPSIGAVAMAFLQAHLPPLKHAGRSLLVAVAAFGCAIIVFGLSRWFALSFAMLLLTGAFDNISVVIRHTLVQLLTPDDMRGRVSAVNNMFIGASNDLGEFESGLVAHLFSLKTSVVGGGIGTIVVVILVALIWPEVRRFGSLREATASAKS